MFKDFYALQKQLANFERRLDARFAQMKAQRETMVNNLATRAQIEACFKEIEVETRGQMEAWKDANELAMEPPQKYRKSESGCRRQQ